MRSARRVPLLYSRSYARKLSIREMVIVAFPLLPLVKRPCAGRTHHNRTYKINVFYVQVFYSPVLNKNGHFEEIYLVLLNMLIRKEDSNKSRIHVQHNQ